MKQFKLFFLIGLVLTQVSLVHANHRLINENHYNASGDLKTTLGTALDEAIDDAGAYIYLYNGTGSERERNNWSSSILATTITATAATTDQTNYDARGVTIYLNITAASGTSPTLDVKLQIKDPVSGTYIDIPGAAFAQKTGTGSDSLTIYPGISETANRKASMVLPRTWRAVATIGGTTPSFTFSLGAHYQK